MSLGVLGKYRLDHRLGGGGMAEVFIASTIGAEGFSRRVAIKRVLPGYSDNPQFAQMFISEAQISSAIVHPNIVSVLDFDRDAENRLFLVMELVEGRDLDALASTGRLPIPVVIFVIGEVLRGLGYAHDLPMSSATSPGLRGIVHRDVSPHNVLLSWEGAVKVSDFGIAKARAASEATASVFIKGKPAYMSPEQANGQPLDGRSDLFAVGVMLWEMLVGRRLFVGEDVRATLAAVLFGQIPRPRTLRPEIGKDLDRVVMKLLERDLPARYATAEAAIEDLMECADAPRSGREALMSALAERYPTEMPVRQSRTKPRGGGTPPAGIVHVDPDARTLSAGEYEGTPAHAHSLGGVRNAQTATLDAKPRNRRAMLIALVLGITAAGAVTAFLVVSSLRHQPTPAARDAQDVAVGSATPYDAGHAEPPTPDAPPTPAPDAALPPDAAAAAAPPVHGHRDAGHHGSATPPPTPPALPPDAAPAAPPAATKYGYLTVRSDPAVRVTVDGTYIGDTAINGFKLPIGPHELVMDNPDARINEHRKVSITDGQTTTIQR